MSMNESEEQSNRAEEDPTPLCRLNQRLPGDFSEEDVAFAQELSTLFALDQEEIPPYFVQTLLDAENPRFQPVEHGLEYKTRAHVFRRLKLRRRLFHLHRPPMASFFTLLPVRSSLLVGVTLLFCMFLTVMFTAPSFATGMTILLTGARTGVKLVHSYPIGVKSSHTTHMRESEADILPKVSLPEALQQLHAWSVYWPQAIPSTYTLDATYLYEGQQQEWVDGPFIELDYSLTGALPRGTGLLAIREFKLQPNVNVLQVVKDGAAQSIKIDQNAGVQAIYVDGQWIARNKFFHMWVYGQRSELIYQKDGIVFWIVGDQRDGMGKEALLKIANSLQTLHLNRSMYAGNDNGSGSVTLLQGDVDGPFTGDLLAISPEDNSSSTYLSLGSTDQTSSGTPPPPPAPKKGHSH